MLLPSAYCEVGRAGAFVKLKASIQRGDVALKRPSGLPEQGWPGALAQGTSGPCPCYQLPGLACGLLPSWPPGGSRDRERGTPENSWRPHPCVGTPHRQGRALTSSPGTYSHSILLRSTTEFFLSLLRLWKPSVLFRGKHLIQGFVLNLSSVCRKK